MFNPHSSFSRPFQLRRLDTAGSVITPQIPPAVSNNSCFLYLERGEVLADLDAEPFLVGQHEFLLIPPGLPFFIKYYNGSAGYMGAFSNTVLNNPNFDILHHRDPLLIGIPDADHVFFQALTEKMLREMDANGGEPTSLLSGTLELMLAQLDAMVGKMPGRSRNVLSSKFLDMVFDRSCNLSGVAWYAERLNISPNHLNRVVKKSTGRSAGEWIDLSRVSLAKLLLRQTDIPMIDVAAKAGFGDQSYFSRFFRKHTGMTPTEFRDK